MEDDGRARILVCEDDGLLQNTLERGLRRAGYLVDCTSTGADAIRQARANPPDAAVLDIGLPDADGRDVCAALRAEGCTAGVVFLTARHHTDDVLSGFAAGGDDYVRKPFEFAELLARIAGVLRRRPALTAPAPADHGRLRIDAAAHGIRYGDRSETLSPTERRVLACMIARRPDVVRRGDLIVAGWPGVGGVTDNTLDQYVRRARNKLKQVGYPEALENVRGVGYRLR